MDTPPLRYRRHIFAGNGQSGSEGRSSGKDGEDITIDVPCGTVVFDAETGQYLCEVTHDQQIVPLLKRRTRRTRQLALQKPHQPHTTLRTARRTSHRTNRHTRTQTTRRRRTRRIPQRRKIHTPLSHISRTPQNSRLPVHHNGTTARHRQLPRQPIIRHGRHTRHHRRSQPRKGLGLRFLRHIERNAVLLFMVPADADDITAQYHILLEELHTVQPTTHRQTTHPRHIQI